jgi:hypothetical protein
MECMPSCVFLELLTSIFRGFSQASRVSRSGAGKPVGGSSPLPSAFQKGRSRLELRGFIFAPKSSASGLSLQRKCSQNVANREMATR